MENGDLVAIPVAGLKELWGTLRGRYPEAFLSSAEDVQSWDEHLAGVAESREMWWAAAWRLDRAVAARSDPDLLWRRAEARSELGRWDEALADYGEALRAAPGQARLWNGKGNAEFSAGRYEAASSAYGKAIERSPDELVYWINRAHAHASEGRLDLAARDFRKVRDLGQWQVSQKNITAAHLAATDLGSGTEGEYRAVCGELLKVGDYASYPDTVASITRAVVACVLAPGAVSDAKALVRLAESLPDTESYRSLRLRLVGAARYRAGEYTQALAALEPAARDGDDPLGLYFLAMTYRRLGPGDDALRTTPSADAASHRLLRGDDGVGDSLPLWARTVWDYLDNEYGRLRPRKGPAPDRPGWHARLVTDLLRREAAATPR